MGDAADDLAAWELLDELGRGAMGTVHRARRRVDGREVALKLVPLARGPRRARFLREGETLARLCHPAIVRIHSLHLGLARGVIELELVEGEPLVDLLNRRGRLGPEEALRIIEEVARGAHHAHEHGVVHRDLKPANVVIAADGRPRILDFGVAKDLEAVERLSQTGTLLGTPTYFAPEQAVGAVDRVGPKVDVWALGVMLWELLEGRPPFEATSMHRLVALLVSVEPPRPRLADGRDAGETGTIALLAMSKDPAERPTALELAELCARARSAGPRLRRPGPVAVRVVGLVLLVVAAMTTGTVVALAARGVGAAPALAVGDPPRTVDGAESEP
ncbi:MAG: serine/threonine protein kinase, partial [Planctomycetota bacterium]|nr:serine/threonine protein kinase [Planctomycetota bacterium]